MVPYQRLLPLAAVLALSSLCPATSEAEVVDMDSVSGPAPVNLGGLRRRADLGFRFAERDGELRVGNVAEDSAAFEAGIREGDIILEINGNHFELPVIGLDMLAQMKSAKTLTLNLGRDEQEFEISYTPPPLDWEQVDGVVADWNVMEMPDGARLRTIVTRPKDKELPLPAVFMIQWVGCSSLEFQHEGPWLMVYRAVAERSGMAMIRVERSANGDSEGPPCHELDMDTEIAHYRYALERLRQHPWVNRERVVLMGNSLGTKTLPIVAQGRKISGAITSSGGGLSYFERMINFDRHALSHEDRDPAEAHDVLMRQMPFQVMYLLEGKTPDEIVAERPDLEGVWETIAHTGKGHHYGRPYRYHYQAAQKNYLAAWLEIHAPILVNFNEYDQFEELRGAELIVDTVNRLRPDSATLAVYESLGHSFYRYPSQQDAYRRRNGEPGQEPAIDTILAWLEEHGLNR